MMWDWGQTLAAVFAGAIGGGIGGLIAWATSFLGAGKVSLLRPLIVIGAAIIGYVNLAPYLELATGPFVRQFSAESIAIEIDRSVREHPMLDAYLDRFPDRGEQILVDAERAFRESGEAGLMQYAMTMGEQVGYSVLLEVGAYASDDDLRRLLDATINVGRLNIDNPQPCYVLFYNQLAPQNIGPEGNAALGEIEGLGQITRAVTLILRNAGQTPIPVDYARGQAAIEGARTELLAGDRQSDIRFLMGARPASETEYQTACILMVDLMESFSAHEDSAAIIRMMYGSGG